MAKAPAPSPERAALTAAHEELRQAQAALDEAEDAHRRALRDYNGATGTVSDIKAQIRELQGRRTYGLPNLKAEVNEGLWIAFSQQGNAERAVGPFGAVEQEARARVAAARFPVNGAQDRVTKAAIAVACAEAEPIAAECLTRVLAAFDVIATYGPDLLAMTDKDLVARDVAATVGSAAGGLLRRAITGWPEFERRYRTSPWRAVVEMLKSDPAAVLPASVP